MHLEPTPAELRARERERHEAYLAALEVERQSMVDLGKPERVEMIDAELKRARVQGTKG